MTDIGGRGSAKVIVALCVAACAACGREAPEEVETTSVVVVKTAPATVGTISGVVRATGVVNPAPGAELIVVAPEPARVAAITRADGDRVRAGEVLVRFDIPGSVAEVERQQAEVSRAEAGLAAAAAAQTRARDLFDRGVAARREVEDATRAVADAQAAIAQANASLAAARAVAARSTVRATFSGRVVRRNHNPGDLVEAAASDPVLRVVDPDRLEVVASIPLADAPRVEVGAVAHLTSAPAETADVQLHVLSRPTTVDPGTSTVTVRLGFSKPIQIPVGAPVQVSIETQPHHDVVLVPESAVIHEADETAAFVASDGTAYRRAVEVGISDGTNVEIRSGIRAGEQVIVDGQAGLPDGAPISGTGPAAGGATDSGRGGASGTSGDDAGAAARGGAKR
jgi:RND family efflux transporter MFP subunit